MARSSLTLTKSHSVSSAMADACTAANSTAGLWPGEGAYDSSTARRDNTCVHTVATVRAQPGSVEGSRDEDVQDVWCELTPAIRLPGLPGLAAATRLRMGEEDSFP